jgi:hypothetical protein
MLNKDALALLSEIEKEIQAKKFKPTIVERDFILKMGSQCRTPQRITDKQVKWLKNIQQMANGKGFKA